MPVVSLPVLPADGLRLTPTDVTQFVRHEQCERLLRYRLADRAGHDFMAEFGVTPQRITPLMSLSGDLFEKGIEAELGKRFTAVNFAAMVAFSHSRPANNADVVAAAGRLVAGETLLLFQVRLTVDLDGWQFRV